jgi:NhaA family Na+:H+ antiporter
MPFHSSTYVAFTRQLIADQILGPAQRFFRKQVASSVLLLAATAIALVWANSNVAETYHSFWHTEFSLSFGKFHISKSLVHWINDGLMALFFFTVGLEIKRELLVGELASPKKALLPVIAALGGMLVPALIYIAFNLGSSNLEGWGIPMATDIAFALGAVAIFGHKLPVNLRIFLAAFAIADDLGAVLVIAIFYTKEIVWSYLLVCAMLIFCLAIANLLWIRRTLVYAALGLAIWFFVLGSGIHPTVAGVIVSFFIPARGRYDTDRFLQNVNQIMEKFKCEEQSCGYSILLNQEHLQAVQSLELACHDVETPLQRLMHGLHPWVAFTILPFFALSNTGLNFHGVNISEVAVHTVSLGILFGLVVGKPLGVMLFSFIAVKSKMGSLPKNVKWSHILGSAMLGGIGFTMSLFISDLSFSSVDMLTYAKMAILSASVLSAVIGITFLGIVSMMSPDKRLTSPDDPN